MITLYDHIQELRAELRGCHFTKSERAAVEAELAKALAEQKIEHHLEIIPAAPHTFHLQPKQMDLRPLVLAFFDKHLKGR